MFVLLQEGMVGGYLPEYKHKSNEIETERNIKSRRKNDEYGVGTWKAK
jgi:hypothetical protein